ncbi:polymeric immunoglobulin receptor isoform X2 [Oncorhynchus mykiss]|uniref:polymeric immunoglobulin receptor isoform X2 n=1 Tax=Oncorhynchus mykiss TaxID=8022 RepID=UPI0018785478|nr:polymeric immunoglobulin receptor isoform X2 [Oncorhynchus mykiss]XP_036840658.1 polymeric immunoglobulin receptor isoform X2 [Oncorhynchus mykiss]
MAPHLLLVLRILFFLTGVSDTQSVSTVSHVSVKQGGSIIIPCLYNQKYRNNVKYGCRGYNWLGCSTVVRTDHPKTSGKTSVSDDINQLVFTVTMTSLSPSDSDYYWCIVERKSKADDGDRLQISVTPGTPELYVDQQQMTGVVGGSVTVLCYYSSQGSRGKWCKMGGPCVAVGLSGDLDGTFVKLVQEQREITKGYVLMVTMSGLMMENTGWYWCEKGKLQMPVHITVNQPTTTQSTTTTTQAPSTHQASLTSAESNASPPTVSPSVTNRDNVVTNENTDEKPQSLLEVLFIPLSLLVVLIAVTLVTLKMLRKHKDKKAKDQPPNTTVQSSDSEQNITYSTVSHIRGSTQQVLNPESHGDLYSTVIPKQHRTAKKDPLPDDAVTYSTVVTKNKIPLPDDAVTYSTVVPKNKTQPNAAEPDDVVYSTVAQHQR